MTSTNPALLVNKSGQRVLSPTRLALAYAARCWRGIVAIIALTIVASAVAMVGPALVAAALAALKVGGDQVAVGTGTPFDLNGLGQRMLNFWPLRLYSDPVTLIVMLGGAYFAQASTAAGVQYVVSLMAVRIRAETTRLIQDDLMGHLLGLSLRFFNRSKAGELVSRLMQDALNAGGSVGPAVQGIFQYGVQVIGYSLYLFSTSAWLTLGALGIVCVHFGLNRLLREPVKRLGRNVQDAQAQLSAFFHEILGSVRVIKSFGAESLAAERSREETDRFRRVRRKQGLIESINDPARTVLDAMAVVAVLIIAALEVRRGQLAPQGLILYVFVARVVIQPVNLLATNYLRLHATSASLARVAEIFSQQPLVVDGELEKSTFDHTLELRDVSFAYEDKAVLKGLSLEILRGEVVAVVGRSGAGKSTLTDLILRLYDPTEGGLFIDGIDIRRLRQTPYRHLFGVVSQETLLLHDTVRNNIRFGRDEITDDRLYEAARLAHAHQFVERLPAGYDTVVGDRGSRLSGGERQRIAIARAIAHRPQILILDEATSSLDSESEREVQLAVDHILQRSTAIIIAHRLSTVLHADKIVFLDDGVIADSGSHQQLFERCLPYRRLCELQFLPGSRVEAEHAG